MNLDNALLRGPMGDMLKEMITQSESQQKVAQAMAAEQSRVIIEIQIKLIDAINRLAYAIERSTTREL